MPMSGFIPPRPGSFLTPHRKNFKPAATILRQKSALLTLPLPLTTHRCLTCHQRSLQVEIQLLLSVMIPVKSPEYLYLHSHLIIHWRRSHQNNPPQFHITEQENVLLYISQVLQNSSHLEFHQRKIPQLNILNQLLLPVLHSQVFHSQSHPRST